MAYSSVTERVTEVESDDVRGGGPPKSAYDPASGDVVSVAVVNTAMSGGDGEGEDSVSSVRDSDSSGVERRAEANAVGDMAPRGVTYPVMDELEDVGEVTGSGVVSLAS